MTSTTNSSPSSLLVAQIVAHPTYTDVRASSESAQAQFSQLPVQQMQYPDYPLPKTFNGAEVWKGLLTEIVDQGKCGSCWAFATTGTLSDRFNILSSGIIQVQLSATKMLLCDFGGREYDIEPVIQTMAEIEQIEAEETKLRVCHGNTLADAWRYLYVIGVPTDQCFPYTLNSHIEGPTLADLTDEELNVPLCSRYAGQYGDLCVDGSPARAYRAIQYYTIPGVAREGGSEKNLRHEIYFRGPISSAFVVYPNFYTFDPKTQVYEWDGKGQPVGGHAVRIVGWGKTPDDGQFWWIANTFGTTWGIAGYFKMRRGTNVCGIEENVIVGLPDFFLGEQDSLKIFNIDPKTDVPEADYKFRKLYSSPHATGGGIDPHTGYTRHFLDILPELRTPLRTVDQAVFLGKQQPFIAAHVDSAASQTHPSGVKNFIIPPTTTNCVARSILLLLLLSIGTLSLVLIGWVLSLSLLRAPKKIPLLLP